MLSFHLITISLKCLLKSPQYLQQTPVRISPYHVRHVPVWPADVASHPISFPANVCIICSFLSPVPHVAIICRVHMCAYPYPVPLSATVNVSAVIGYACDVFVFVISVSLFLSTLLNRVFRLALVLCVYLCPSGSGFDPTWSYLAHSV